MTRSATVRGSSLWTIARTVGPENTNTSALIHRPTLTLPEVGELGELNLMDQVLAMRITVRRLPKNREELCIAGSCIQGNKYSVYVTP